LPPKEDKSVRKRLREKLQNSLIPQELSGVYNSFDIIGDVAIIKTPNPKNAQTIAQQIMNISKISEPSLYLTSASPWQFCLRELKLLAAKSKLRLPTKKTAASLRKFGDMLFRHTLS
jgi:tRNA G37 N-methylase Trm5